MAKKKTARKTGRERIPFQIRLQPEVHEAIAKMAEAGGISMNQLTEGLLAGCAKHLEHGRPFRRKDGSIDVRDDRGCYFVGKPRTAYRYVPSVRSGPGDDDWEPHPDYQGSLEGFLTPNRADDDKTRTAGFVWFEMDYSQQPIKTWEQDET